MWRTLIVDDEPPIRAELRYLLSRDARVGTVLEAGSVSEAVELVVSERPEVVFLDISMPGTNGMRLAETLQNLKRPPAIVFVTAYAEYAAEAFDLEAVDYVLKPIEESRLAKALDRVEKALAASRPATHGQTLRIPVERDGVRTFIPAHDILYVEACGDYVRVHLRQSTCLVNGTLSSLERRLAPENFLRVHRSYIVNLDEVHDVQLSSAGLMELSLTGADELIPVSRRRAAAVRERLGIG